MFSHEVIDSKYKTIAREQGMYIEIAYEADLPNTQEIEENGEGFTIKLSSDRIEASDYEEFLSYNVRKIILPRLRLETGRLVIRPFQRSDAQAYLAFFSDETDAYMDSGAIFTAMDSEYEQLMDDFSTQTRYTIVHRGTDQAVGTIHLMDVNDRAVETTEIGYSIAPAHKRRGYAYEALSALLHYLLYDLNLDLVIAGAFPDNAPSLALIEKLGFQYEGLRHKAIWNHLRGPMDLQYYYLEKGIQIAKGGHADAICQG